MANPPLTGLNPYAVSRDRGRLVRLRKAESPARRNADATRRKCVPRTDRDAGRDETSTGIDHSSSSCA